ncbi:hypothetical protein OG729_00305 [Streptomyces sp. NBC_00210]
MHGIRRASGHADGIGGVGVRCAPVYGRAEAAAAASADDRC